MWNDANKCPLDFPVFWPLCLYREAIHWTAFFCDVELDFWEVKCWWDLIKLALARAYFEINPQPYNTAVWQWEVGSKCGERDNDDGIPELGREKSVKACRKEAMKTLHTYYSAKWGFNGKKNPHVECIDPLWSRQSEASLVFWVWVFPFCIKAPWNVS